jgi:hypothetical protein
VSRIVKSNPANESDQLSATTRRAHSTIAAEDAETASHPKGFKDPFDLNLFSIDNLPFCGIVYTTKFKEFL